MKASFSLLALLSLAGVYPEVSPLLCGPDSFCKLKHWVNWVLCVLGEEVVCMAVKMHWEQKIWAEIVQTDILGTSKTCGFFPNTSSLCNTGVICVKGQKQVW